MASARRRAVGMARAAGGRRHDEGGGGDGLWRAAVRRIALPAASALLLTAPAPVRPVPRRRPAADGVAGAPPAPRGGPSALLLAAPAPGRPFAASRRLGGATAARGAVRGRPLRPGAAAGTARRVGLGAECGGGGEDEGGAEDARLRRARLQLERLAGLESAGADDPFWATPEPQLDGRGLPPVGTVLLAHPAAYFADMDGDPERVPAALARTVSRPGLLPGPRAEKRQARSHMPVVLITRRHPEEGTFGLLVCNLWTGQLLGDLQCVDFMTRPLHLGGPPERIDKERVLQTMLHPYPDLPGARQITDDGLAVSHSYEEACRWINEGPGSSLRFRFFTSDVHWPPEEEGELSPRAGVWLPVRCSRDLLLREPDSAFEETVWAQIADCAGGEVAEAARRHSLLPEGAG